MTDYIPVEKSENNLIVDVNNEPDYQPDSFKKTYNKKGNREGYITIAISFILWTLFYKLSLVGGDLGWIKDHLFLIGSLLFTSFLSYSVMLWRVAFLRISKRLKLLSYCLIIFSLVGFLIYDHGELFDYHGMYNFMVFCLFVFIGDGIAIIIYFWYKLFGRKKFIISFTSFILIIVVILIISLRHYMNIWGNGYLNKKIEEGGQNCKVRRPIPWFDLLPRGTQNFWTGSQSCAREEKFDAFFDSTEENKLVVSGCPKSEKITFMILPETRNLTFYQKQDDIFRESVMSLAEEKIYDYTEPINLPDIEAVYITCGEQSKLVTRLAGRRVEPQVDKVPKEKLNVLLMYFDAVSRRQFFRNLPKTVKKLESLNNSGIMHLNQFFRYGVIGFNTNRNSLGLFAGVQLERGKKGVPIWEDYRNHGYVAGAADDHCEDWDTNYNNRTEISLDHELIAPFCLPEYHERTGNPHGNFKGAYSIRRRCITGQYVHNYVLNYTRQFIDTYDSTNPWFFRSSFIEGHEGTAEVLSLMDDDLVNFFDGFTEEVLNHTAIFIMSDHGLHMGLSYLFSDQGRTEHKLPHLTTLIPEQFLNKYPELRTNLDNNEQKLISAFDIYATLRDVLDFDILHEPMEKTGEGIDILKAKINHKRSYNNLNYLNDYFEEMDRLNKKYQIHIEKRDKIIYGPAVENATIVWGNSLLRHVSENRTCEQIMISSEDCVCH
ncbi:DUF229-domain-containing protein [Piromyces finnis]|uniref:DUF229-domain-containing protein n=1 Tax=Piromyces finnis TaxID=1754191 RepID=A0A1Y1VHI8_9FUNG|nr:DUF229-domain-containing protein [Piromyces finnis]|eukprot:ORX56509.1 DUF229-domain-containing protein [Piromyces finnis]